MVTVAGSSQWWESNSPDCFPHAQHEATTVADSDPHVAFHPGPMEPPVHHLFSLYILQVPYMSLNPGVSSQTITTASRSQSTGTQTSACARRQARVQRRQAAANSGAGDAIRSRGSPGCFPHAQHAAMTVAFSGPHCSPSHLTPSSLEPLAHHLLSL